VCRSFRPVVLTLSFLLSAGCVVMHEAEETRREERKACRVVMMVRFCMPLCFALLT